MNGRLRPFLDTITNKHSTNYTCCILRNDGACYSPFS